MVASCSSPSSSKNDDQDNPAQVKTMEDIRVSPNFDWKTFRDVRLTLDGGEGLFEVVSPRGVVYHKANLLPNQEYSFNLTVPTYERNVMVKHAGQSVPLDLSDNSAQMSFNK